MKITLSPIRFDSELSLARAVSALIINGEVVDLAGYDAETAPHPSIIGQPELVDGEWHVTVLMPYGPPPADISPEALLAVTFPEPVVQAGDGSIHLPNFE